MSQKKTKAVDLYRKRSTGSQCPIPSRTRSPDAVNKVYSFFFGTRQRQAITGIVVIGIVLVSIGFAVVPGSIGGFTRISQQTNAQFRVVDPVRGLEMTGDFGMVAYTAIAEPVTSMSDLSIFESWDDVGDVSLEFVSIDKYYVNVFTSLPEYENCSSLWGLVSRGGVYLIDVYLDPEETNVKFYDDERSSPIIGLPDGKDLPDVPIGERKFYMVVEASPANETAWKAVFDVNFSFEDYKMLSLNVTFNTTVFYVNGGVKDVEIVSEYASGFAPPFSGSILPRQTLDSESNLLYSENIIFAIPFLNGVAEYGVWMNENVSITRVEVMYGNHILEVLS